jgi:hypothetical protein
MTVNEAREQFRPEEVKVLFIAEAPRCADDRFFYFTQVNKGDSLFLYVIRTVFTDLEGIPTKKLRKKKEELLYRFQEEGYYLEYSLFIPLPKGTTSGQKLKCIIEGQEELNEKIMRYKSSAKVVLLSSTVFRANYSYLKDLGYEILNVTAIPFPGSGQQTRYKQEIAKIDLWD